MIPQPAVNPQGASVAGSNGRPSAPRSHCRGCGLRDLDTVGSLRCDARALEGMCSVVGHWNLDRPASPPQQQGGR